MNLGIFVKDIFRKFPRLLAINTFFLVLASVVEAATLFTLVPLIDFLIHPDMTGISPLTEKVIQVFNSIGLPLSLGNYLTFFVAFVIISCALRIFSRYWIEKTRYALIQDLMLGTFTDFFKARWMFFTSNKQGVLLNTVIGEVERCGSAFDAMVLFIAGLLQLTFYLMVPLFISWPVTLISLGIALLFMWPFLLLGKVSYELGKINTATANHIIAVIQESFNLVKMILGFGRQEHTIAKLRTAFDDHRNASIRSRTITMSIPILYQPFGVLVLITALYAAKGFQVSLAEMTVLLLALLKVVFSIGNLASHKNKIANLAPSYEQLVGLQTRAKELEQTSGGRAFNGFAKEISVETISFAYPGRDPLLHEINMKIPKGKMIAIVGESGAGKSTLADLILGFHEPTNGKITFDGIDVREFNIHQFRDKIGYVPQESTLFDMSIRDNLLWAKPDATDEEIKQACRQANALEFIERFPEGYGTLVGFRGVRLSGGQIQRIALARALLKKPDLLVLDEATSSLDTQSERLIQLAIENVVRETTVIVIAHRLSTIKNADFIYVIQNGRIVESGSYEQLIKNNDHFNQMVSPQILKAQP